MPNSDMSTFPKKMSSEWMGVKFLKYISAQEPDGGVLGGVQRGVGSIGFQVSRTTNTQVPSGTYSGAFGQNNTVSGDSSFAFGSNSNVSGAASVSFGDSVSMSGSNSLAIGGTVTIASTYSLGIGSGVTPSGISSMATGLSVSTNAIVGRRVSGYAFNFMKSILVIGIQTTDATPAGLTSNLSTAGANNQINVNPTGGSVYFEAILVAKRSASSQVAMWTISGLGHRTTTAATTTLVTSTVTTVSNAPAWTNPSVSADTTNGRFKITVTGNASTNIRWVAYVKSSESIYA